MHAYISMKIDPSSPALPIQYNYLVQSAIYAALPEDVASRIHDEGYSAGNRRFKMFSFSQLWVSSSLIAWQVLSNSLKTPWMLLPQVL